MSTLQIVFGIILVVMSLVLIAAVLMQSGKDTKLSGAITGSADTFFGKSKANTRDRFLSRLTIVVSVLFAILVVVVYVM